MFQQLKGTDQQVEVTVINDENDLIQVLRACGLRARVAITILADKQKVFRTRPFIDNLKIETMEKGGIVAVAIRGEWQFVPRTFKATLDLKTAEMFLAARNAFLGVVEKIKIISTINEVIDTYYSNQHKNPLSNKVREMLASNPDILYDRDIFACVCNQTSVCHSSETADLPERGNLEDFLMVISSNYLREEFLRVYSSFFRRARIYSLSQKN